MTYGVTSCAETPEASADRPLPQPPIHPVIVAVEPVRVLVLPSGKVDRANAAKALGRTPKTLADWALKGIGPRAENIAGRIFYDWEEVLAFSRGEAA